MYKFKEAGPVNFYTHGIDKFYRFLEAVLCRSWINLRSELHISGHVKEETTVPKLCPS